MREVRKTLFDELRGKNAFVTGGSRGIGKSIVKILAKHGVNVAFTYHSNPVEIACFTEGLEDNCGEIYQYQMDVCNVENVREVVSRVEKDLGDINYLVNNAGITKDRYMMLMSKADWDQVINTNLNGVFLVTKEVLPSILASKKGSIVNMSSVAGVVGIAGQTNYCASKAGIIGLTKALALEVSKKNIRVNAIAPGYVETEMLDTLNSSVRGKIKDSIPLKRIADPKEIASVVLFLLSDGASYITGTTVQVDGGMID